MKKLICSLLSVIMVLSLCSCSSKEPATAEDIYYALEAYGFPVYSPTVYDEDSDPNELLGRPNQYTSKVVFFDKSGSSSNNSDECVIEVFENESDAESRYDYVKALSESIAMLAEYDYLNGVAILRIDNCVSPRDAAKYEEWFMSQNFTKFYTKEANSETEFKGTEPTGDTVRLTMPKYLIPDDEISYWEEMANNSNEDSGLVDVEVSEDFVIITVSKDTYTNTFGVKNYTQLMLSALSDYSSVRNVSISDDFLTSTIFVDESDFYSRNDAGSVKKAFISLCERNAYVGNYKPTITINVRNKNTDALLYSFKYTHPAERIIDISAKELVTAYTKNEESADEQYNGKYLDVTGEVADVELDTNGLPGWILVKPETGYSVCWVRCNLQESAYDRAAQFKEGDIITVLGKCSGQTLHIQLDDCVVY